MNDSFIQKRHAGFQAPEGVVFDVVKKATGKTPIRRTRIVEGNDNEVYDVETDVGNFIVRIHRFGDVGYRQEAWAIEECRKRDVPVPEVLLIDTVELDGRQHDAMVQKKLPGKNFGQIIEEGARKNDIEKVLYEAGEILKRIHQVQVKGFYRLNGDGTWDFNSWERVMDSSIKGRESEKECIMGVGFTEEEFAFMLQMHQVYTNQYPCRQPVLCHGDYSPDHWFVNENLEITGIIDFGDMQGGPEILDLAIFEAFEPALDSTALLKGYGILDLNNQDFQKKLNLQKIIFLMGLLAHFVREENQEEINDTIPQLKQTIKRLSDSWRSRMSH